MRASDFLLNEFALPGGDDREPDEEHILKQLASQWWLGTEQQMARAQQTLAAMGWEIGQDESGDDDAGVFVIRVGDEHGDSYIAFNHSDLEQGMTEGLRDPKDNPCWKGYHPVGTKEKNGRTVPNCVPNESIAEAIKVPQKPRQGPLRTQTGAGKHSDKKKDQKQGKEKYKSKDPELAEGYYNNYDNNRTGFGRRDREDDEHHQLDREREQIEKSGTWYIRLNGKLIRDKQGNPFTYRGKAAANKAALTMQAKLFNQGKEFMLTTNPNDKP
jgi:hypothetical protein